MENPTAITVDSNAMMNFFVLCCSVGHVSIVVRLFCNNALNKGRRNAVPLDSDVIISFQLIDDIWLIFLESLAIEILDKFRQRCFPSLLLVICQTAKFLWIHSKLSSHLDVHIREAKLFLGLYPFLVLIIHSLNNRFLKGRKWIMIGRQLESSKKKAKPQCR